MIALLFVLLAMAAEQPAPAPPELRPYLGEYGSGVHHIIVREAAGHLEVVEGQSRPVPLKPAKQDRFSGAGKTWVFERDSKQGIVSVQTASLHLARVKFPEDGAVFRIQPERPVEQLRQEAPKHSPPAEGASFRKADLVDLSTLPMPIHLDIRYATDNNFMGAPMYTQARAFLQRPAAEALAKAAAALKAQGFGLLIHDAYRPWYVTWMFWEATPPKQRIFVANPAEGSRHNRGCAVDLSMYELATGKPVTMPSVYDEMTDRAYPNYPGGSSAQRWRRSVLREAMEAQGFVVNKAEWWHFDFKDWKQYPIGTERFEDLKP